MPAIQGQCLCGQTTVTIENGDSFKDQVCTTSLWCSLKSDRSKIICHCWDCKQTSGSAFSVNILAPKKDVKIEGAVKQYDAKAASGNTG